MKTIIRNFISVIRRFKMATLLNILGLSVAFTAVIVIMMQVTYDLGFDGNQPEKDNIYRIEAVFEGREIAVLPRPFIEGFKAAAPQVRAAAVTNVFLSEMVSSFVGVEKEGSIQYYSEKIMTVSPDFTEIFHFNMKEGVATSINEPNTIIIPQTIAQRMFGSESAVNKHIIQGEQKFLIGGVYIDFPGNASTQNCIYGKIPDDENKEHWGSFNYEGYVLMDPAARMDDVLEAYVNTIDRQAFKKAGLANVDFKATPLQQIHFDTHVEFDFVKKVSRQTIWVLIAIALVIMVIAAINFTNYSIALTPLRIKSVNTQKVLGASEKGLRRSLLIEAVLTCLLAWVMAIFFTHLLSMSSIPQIISADMALYKNVNLILGIGLLAFAVGIFAGVYPAYYITSFAPALVLKGSFGLSPKGRQLRNTLVGIQFVASFALIVVSLFMYLQVQFMQNSSLGFDKEQIIVTNVNDQILKSKEAFANELKSNPNIETLSYSESVFSGLDSYSTWGREIRGEKKMFLALAVDTGFLRTMGIPLLEGRDLTLADTNSDGPVFIFNEKGRDEMGLSLGDKTERGEEIIGFIPNIKITSLRKEIEPMAFYYANRRYSSGLRWAYIRVKAGSDLAATMQHIEKTLTKLSPGFPFNIRFYDNILNNLYSSENNLTSLITWFSLIAVLISMVGVFGLVVFESEYKRKEIGVRKVLGSTTAQVLAMFNVRYVKILCICFIVAAPIAWYAVSRWLENFAYRTPMYWWVFLLSFLLITAITMATVTFQSWRVADANPVDSIKMD